MTLQVDKKAIKQSFGRALTAPTFLVRFYETLIACSPEIAEKFANTDLSKQYELLEHSLAMAMLFPDNNVVSKQVINKIRESHNRQNLNISPELYTEWLDSLMVVLNEVDSEFSPELEQQWRSFLTIAIDHIKAGY